MLIEFEMPWDGNVLKVIKLDYLEAKILCPHKVAAGAYQDKENSGGAHDIADERGVCVVVCTRCSVMNMGWAGFKQSHRKEERRNQ